jgi:hypothetical protein
MVALLQIDRIEATMLPFSGNPSGKRRYR